MMKMLIFMLILFFLMNYWLNSLMMLNFNFWILFLMFVLFFENLQLHYFSIYLNYMFNKISFYLVLLSIWILFLMCLSFMYNMNFKVLMMMLMLILLMILILFFMSMNLFNLYLWFEVSLIPILMIIILGGNSMDRIYSSIYFLMYTLIFSLPMLLMIFFQYNNINTMDLNFLYLNYNLNIYMYILLNFGFFVKLPLFILHIWLPKAHVEAPVFGSMILAAILLKMGSYGIYCLINYINIYYIKFNLYMIILSLVGGIYLSILCLIQVDMKMLVAYSSVVHMGMMISGMMTNSMLGILGGYLMMIAHGLCSSGLFFLVNMMYIRSNSRSILVNKGFSIFMPFMSILWFMMCVCNLSCPFSLNLFSEIMLIISLMNWNFNLIYLLFMFCLFSSLYSIYLFSVSFHGIWNYNNVKFYESYMIELMNLFFHLMPLNLIWINMMILI